MPSHCTQCNSAGGSLRALHADRYKLIEAPRPELYDLTRDPDEQVNLYYDRPQTAAAMLRRLRKYNSEPIPITERARSYKGGASPY
jgi:hypothetical protein